MAAHQDLLVGISENVATAESGGATTATESAPGLGSQLYITGFSISAGAAPSSSQVAQIRRNGGVTILRNFRIPNAAFAPIIYEFKRPIRVPENQDADITIASLGVTVRVELYSITRPVSA